MGVGSVRILHIPLRRGATADLGEAVRGNPAPDVVLVGVTIALGCGLPAFFYIASLTAEVREDGLYYRFFPLHLSSRRICLKQIRAY
jgi:hypothetical protein